VNPTQRFHIRGGNATGFFVDNDGSQFTQIDFGNNGTIRTSLYWDNTVGQFVLGTGPLKLPRAGLVMTTGLFSGLPTPVEGMFATITDSTTAVWGATITGGGTNHVLGYYDGTNWTVVGK
jgi:hypothetical protein